MLEQYLIAEMIEKLMRLSSSPKCLVLLLPDYPGGLDAYVFHCSSEDKIESEASDLKLADCAELMQSLENSGDISFPLIISKSENEYLGTFPVTAEISALWERVEIYTGILFPLKRMHPDLERNKAAVLGCVICQQDERILDPDGSWLNSTAWEDSLLCLRLLASAAENDLLFQENQTLQAQDPLTGLANWRYFKDVLTRQVEAALYLTDTNYAPVFGSILMIDVWNKCYGKHFGTPTYKMIADLLKRHIRPIDIACLWWSGVINVHLPQMNGSETRYLADQLNTLFLSEAIEIRSDKRGIFNNSFGIACYPEHAPDVDALIENCQTALQNAIERGRNCTVMYEQC